MIKWHSRAECGGATAPRLAKQDFCVYYTIKSAKVHTILNYFLLQYALCCMQQVFYLLILIIYEKYGILIAYLKKYAFAAY